MTFQAAHQNIEFTKQRSAKIFSVDKAELLCHKCMGPFGFGGGAQVFCPNLCSFLDIFCSHFYKFCPHFEVVQKFVWHSAPTPSHTPMYYASCTDMSMRRINKYFYNLSDIYFFTKNMVMI